LGTNEEIGRKWLTRAEGISLLPAENNSKTRVIQLTKISDTVQR
jgi:hypothetical protein